MNEITTIAFQELCDGRNFFIPAYQRGYRWTKRQVEDLLNDLDRFMRQEKAQESFYCLQPLIVQRVSDMSKLDRIAERHSDLPQTHRTYELTDGQQRLTTLLLLYRYLLSSLGEDGKSYQLLYETRPELCAYLSSCSDRQPQNIDEEHIQRAYQTIVDWFGKYPQRESSFLQLLRQTKESTEACGSVRFIYYELGQGKDLIREFRSINSGKIPLTESELIKGLFLQRPSSQEGVRVEAERSLRALEWERMENRLLQADFWHFLSPKTGKEEERMDTLLRLCSPEAGKATNELYRHYDEQLCPGGVLEQDKVREQWNKLIATFRLLEDWYADPYIYNLIGFLTHADKSLTDIKKEYDGASDKQDFLDRLKKLVIGQLRIKKLSELYYGKHNKEIRHILLLFNVQLLNSQLEKLRLEKREVLNSSSYKFPFDIFVLQQWDVEHIDSATAYKLKGKVEQKLWIEEALPYISHLKPEDLERINSLRELENYEECIALIQQLAGESSPEDSGLKDGIGNLTLLDSTTNRSYGNSIFPAKRKKILKVIREGKYILPGTQLIFYKNFTTDSLSDALFWTDKSKQAYQPYLAETLKDYGITE